MSRFRIASITVIVILIMSVLVISFWHITYKDGSEKISKLLELDSNTEIRVENYVESEYRIYSDFYIGSQDLEESIVMTNINYDLKCIEQKQMTNFLGLTNVDFCAKYSVKVGKTYEVVVFLVKEDDMYHLYLSAESFPAETKKRD